MPKRTDANHADIVRALRQAGATVQSLAEIGKGCPDLLVGKCGRNVLMEVKDGNAPPSRQKLTPDEKEWHDSWRGQVVVITSIDEALKAIQCACNALKGSIRNFKLDR